MFNIFNWFKRQETAIFADAKALETKGSAFVRAAAHEAEVLSTKAKIVMLDTANAAAHKAIDALEHEAVRVHAAQDEIAARRAKLATLL